MNKIQFIMLLYTVAAVGLNVYQFLVCNKLKLKNIKKHFLKANTLLLSGLLVFYFAINLYLIIGLLVSLIIAVALVGFADNKNSNYEFISTLFVCGLTIIFWPQVLSLNFFTIDTMSKSKEI